MVDWERHVRPVPRYWDLLQKRGRDLRSVDLARLAASFSDAELTDLQVHFNLAWMGFGALADDEGLRALAQKGRGYGREDVAYVLAAQRRIMARGRASLARRSPTRGQVELSTTPYYHPILPLLCDTDAARRALPGARRSRRASPTPRTRAGTCARRSRSHTRRFGAPPAGMWPAEGSVSPGGARGARLGGRPLGGERRGRAAPLAPGRRAAARARSTAPGASRPARRASCAMLFRDRSLSDVIGFTYAQRPGAATRSRTSSPTSRPSATRGRRTASRAPRRWASSSTARTRGSTTRAPGASSSTGSTARSRRATGSRP